MIFPEYTEWAVRGREWEDQWNYREYQKYPRPEASEEVIMDFISDAKEAEKAIEEDLMADGYSKEEAYKKSCQWPLVDDAPMGAIRNFIGCQYTIQEMSKRGIDP